MRSVVQLAAIVLLALGCTERRAAQPLEPLTIAVGTLPNFRLVYVAQAKGYFEREGLAVSLQPHPFGKLALAALLAGQADLAACAETPVVFAELRGDRLSVLAAHSTATRNNAVLARVQAGITRPADLAGKRIGVTLATSGDFFLDTFLLRYGVDRAGVRLVDLKPDEMAGALERGEVDAVATWSPTVQDLTRRFAGQLTTHYVEDLHAEAALLVGRRGFAERRPEAARKVLRALLVAETLFREQPAEARRLAAAQFAEDPAVLDVMLGQFDYRVRLDQSLVVLMEEEARWARRIGQAGPQATPSFLEAIDPAPLLSLKPEAVGLIR